MAKVTYTRYDAMRGSTVHTVEDGQGKVLGWVHEIMGRAYYAKHFDALYKDNTRYTRLEDAIEALDNKGA